MTRGVEWHRSCLVTLGVVLGHDGLPSRVFIEIE